MGSPAELLVLFRMTRGPLGGGPSLGRGRGLGTDAGACGRMLESVAGSWQSLVVFGPGGSAVIMPERRVCRRLAAGLHACDLLGDFPPGPPLLRSQLRLAFAPDLCPSFIASYFILENFYCFCFHFTSPLYMSLR